MDTKETTTSKSTSSVEEWDDIWLEEFGELFMSWFHSWLEVVIPDKESWWKYEGNPTARERMAKEKANNEKHPGGTD